MPKPSDAISGWRNLINAGEIEALTFPYFEPSDEGKPSKVRPCPVKRGDSFELRECRITMGTPQRIGKHGSWQWRVPFTRHQRVTKDRVRLLKPGSGYTDDARQAQGAAEVAIDDHWREVPENTGPPPEPEAIDPEIIKTLPTTVAAQARYEREQHERREAFDALPLSEKVARLEAVNDPRARRQLRAIRSQVAEGAKRAGLDRAA